jgi:hypothetical protein
MDSLPKSGLSIRSVCIPLFSLPRRSKQTMTGRMTRVMIYLDVPLIYVMIV